MSDRHCQGKARSSHSVGIQLNMLELDDMLLQHTETLSTSTLMRLI